MPYLWLRRARLAQVAGPLRASDLPERQNPVSDQRSAVAESGESGLVQCFSAHQVSWTGRLIAGSRGVHVSVLLTRRGYRNATAVASAARLSPQLPARYAEGSQRAGAAEAPTSLEAGSGYQGIDLPPWSGPAHALWPFSDIYHHGDKCRIHASQFHRARFPRSLGADRQDRIERAHPRAGRPRRRGRRGVAARASHFRLPHIPGAGGGREISRGALARSAAAGEISMCCDVDFCRKKFFECRAIVPMAKRAILAQLQLILSQMPDNDLRPLGKHGGARAGAGRPKKGESRERNNQGDKKDNAVTLNRGNSV